MGALKTVTLRRLEELFGDFPDRPAALIPSLYIVQEEENHLTEENLSGLADLLDMPKSSVFETATFYSLFSFKPQGRHVIRLCRSICCWLNGSDALEEAVRASLGVGFEQPTPDGRFILKHSECLAACDRAPAIQVDDRIFGPVTPAEIAGILEQFP
jgi:NADH-quinone oxidoreductase subunit E